MTRCSICKNFTVKDSPHRALGLYNCRVMPAWSYPNPFIERQCKDFAEVPADQLQARIDWEKSR